MNISFCEALAASHAAAADALLLRQPLMPCYCALLLRPGAAPFNEQARGVLTDNF